MVGWGETDAWVLPITINYLIHKHNVPLLSDWADAVCRGLPIIPFTESGQFWAQDEANTQYNLLDTELHCVENRAVSATSAKHISPHKKCLQ